MARYDAEGYNARGRRQILGYSRAVQGGADEARARANQRIAEGWNPSLRFARQRAQRVAEAKAAGTFDATREAYNQNGQNEYQMDAAGNISKGVNVGYAGDNAKPYQYVPPKPVRSTPLNYQRPADQRVADIVGMASPTGLINMARQARRRGTLVIK
jgi:hypothetical protein